VLNFLVAKEETPWYIVHRAERHFLKKGNPMLRENAGAYFYGGYFFGTLFHEQSSYSPRR